MTLRRSSYDNHPTAVQSIPTRIGTRIMGEKEHSKGNNEEDFSET
jgi:hypothetical protein